MLYAVRAIAIPAACRSSYAASHVEQSDHTAQRRIDRQNGGHGCVEARGEAEVSGPVIDGINNEKEGVLPNISTEILAPLL